MPPDETQADDGAIFDFWDFVRLRRALGRPELDLETVIGVFIAIRKFELADDS